MTIGSLFSGIGGLELGLEWAGLGPVLWQVEIDPFCRAVLRKHWPAATQFEDVTHVGRADLVPVDVICGGFPCQDLSVAGKRTSGLDGARSGLWREYARIVDELRPRAVVIENVPPLIARGLDRVVGDLERCAYRVAARLLKASDVGAPHKRERLFIVAHSDDGRRDARTGEPLEQRLPAPRPHGIRDEGQAEPRDDGARGGRLAEPGMGRGPHGLPARLVRWPAGPSQAQHAWEPPRMIPKGTEVANRRAQLKAYGNGVVPELSYEVGIFVRELLEVA